MGRIHIGLNAEFSRSSDKPFEWAVKAAAEMGYQYFEPMIHFGRELMSEAGYFHTVSMFDDPYRIKDACDKAGLKISGLQSHGPLGRPDVHGEYIKLAIRVAAEIGVPVINTDEGIKAKWTTEEEDFVLIKYTLQEAAFIAERRGVKIGIEPHAQYSRHPDGLDRIYNLVKSPAIGINFDTGNAYLCGHDVYAWLERVAGRLVHLHAKDISVAHSEAERGKVTGTPVGCACGEGVLDWKRIIGIVTREMPARHRLLGRMRHAGAGGQEPGTSESAGLRAASPQVRMARRCPRHSRWTPCSGELDLAPMQQNESMKSRTT
jgi:sugar phosphate isomerase/epimerase